ncbi:tRNAse Z TRZ4, mitochondrial-like [Gossypium hirsutum]|uniref:ribonuclease Z n=1 Tax=Gossypium hirsutum TaxID=3635 RepID=A0ABM3BHN1_GOSHI|nr:tRNAse Z TRZ4, mitochondrial-like [Gossypium hirsutum]
MSRNVHSQQQAVATEGIIQFSVLRLLCSCRQCISRFPLKHHTANSTNTTAYIQILGVGMDTHDTMPSILLFFDRQRFIFNAGEGLQRFCAEHKIKLSKIDHICLSRVCSETVGGLPGLLLTLAGMGDGVPVNIWGPSNLNIG